MRNNRIRNMTQAALLAALMAVCAWISIPAFPASFTLQTFGLCLTLGLLGGKWGSIAIWLYLGLGAVGLPVFSGFRGGLSCLLGPTGGFLWGFALAGPVYGLAGTLGSLPGMVAALAVSYLCGCLWYPIFAPGTSLGTAFLVCAAPYLPWEMGKVALAWNLHRRIRKHIP